MSRASYHPVAASRAERRVERFIALVLVGVLLGFILGPWIAEGQFVAGSVNISRWLNSTAPTVGQKAMASSVPMVIASDQSSVPVTPLANSSVNVNQYGGVATTLGQKVMASSVPVVVSSDQSSIPTTQGALTSIVTGQQAVTATAAVLPTNTAKRLCIRVIPDGTQDVFFGPSTVTTANGQVIAPGDGWCGNLDNSNRVFVIAASTGSTIAFDVLN